MAGPEPAMRAETAYLTLLGQAKSYKVTDGKLTLYDSGGNKLVNLWCNLALKYYTVFLFESRLLIASASSAHAP